MSSTLTSAQVPKLRFPGFEGEWRTQLLDQFAVRGSGHTPSKSHPEYYGGKIKWISLADSKRLDKGYIEETNTSITEAGIKNSSAVLHPAETVILSRDAGVGKSAVMKRSMAVSQHFIAWRPIDQVSSSWFIYYWLQVMKPRFENIAIGNTIKTIGLPYFKKLEIVAPSFPEQQKIAAFLTAVDGRIEQLSRKKALLEATKKGVMQQLFTQTLRFQDDHGHDFPDWEEVEFGSLGKFIGGGTPSRTKEDYWQGETPWVSSSDLVQESITEVKLTRFITQQAIAETATKLVPKGSVLIVSRVGVGKAAIAPCDLCTSQDFTSLIPHSADARFLAYLLKASLNRLLGFNQGTSIQGFTKEDISTMRIGLPSLPEQTKIAGFLSALDGKIGAVGEQMRQTQAWKKGLLQQMFV